MKTFHILAPLLLTAICTSAIASTDHSYYVTELSTQQRFDIYNDGQNTYVQSVPGLIVSGATADGDMFIVHGIPGTIRGYLNGKPITIVRGAPPAIKPVPPDAAVVNAKLKKLTDDLAALTAKASPQAMTATTGAGSAATTRLAAAPVPASTAAGKPDMQATTAATGAGSAAMARPATAPVPAHSMSAKPGINDVVVWTVSPADRNLRQLIDRYASSVGWVSQWDVDKDILVNFSDQKPNNFKAAVRYVLASTQFGDLKVKPCFYSNAVVRVVPATTKCNPNE